MTTEDDVPRIAEFLRKELATVLATDADSIADDTPLTSLGVDSLRFVELLIIIEKEFGVRLIEAGLTRDDLADVTSLAKCIAKTRRT